MKTKREHIAVYDAQDITLMKLAALYKAIQEKRMPSIRYVDKGKVKYAIPTEGLMQWLQRKVDLYEAKANKYKKLQNKLRDYINGR